MIVNDKDAAARLASPMNLINQLRCATGTKRQSAMSLFGIDRKTSQTSLQTSPGERQVEEVKITFNPFQIPPQTPQRQIEQPLALIPSSQSEGLADILENHESQIKLGLAHDKALDLLNRSVDALSIKLNEVRADRLPAVISAASKTVESIRKERNENSKDNKNREVHYHFYTPDQKAITDYEVIDVAGV